MQRFHGILPFLIIAVGPVAFCSCQTNDEQNQPVSIVLIYADDLGWSDVGYNGSTYYETPNIDRLAAEGMEFTDAYANAPYCSPSRASLFSGLYTPRHEIFIPGRDFRGPEAARRLIPPVSAHNLDSSFVLISEMLKAHGYTTGYVGKWHLHRRGQEAFKPPNRGFDFYAGGYEGTAPTYYYPYHERTNTRKFLENLDLSRGGEGEYLTDRLTEEAVGFMARNRDRPFFLSLAHYAPHVPLEGKPALVEKYRTKSSKGEQDNPIYAAMVESLDQSVGAIVNALDTMGLSSNTALFFYSDNGGFSLATSNKPLRGGKGNLYEGGIRVPLLVKWPGVVEAGRQYHGPVIGTDLYPTMLDLAGIEPGNLLLDGTSILPILAGTATEPQRPAIYWFTPHYLETYDSAYYERFGLADEIVLTGYGRLKQDSAFIAQPSDVYPAWRSTPCAAVRVGDYKLIHFFDNDIVELYNLRNDIGERVNLADQMPDKRDELALLLEQWLGAVDAPYPLEENPAYDSSAYVNYQQTTQ